jgi:hypothetical protein
MNDPFDIFAADHCHDKVDVATKMLASKYKNLFDFLDYIAFYTYLHLLFNPFIIANSNYFIFTS